MRRLRLDPTAIVLILCTALATGYTIYAAETADAPGHAGFNVRPDYPAWYYQGK